jgi:queuine tRNA-ribosyltransferase
MPVRFQLIHKDRKTQARAGTIITPHGTVPTPLFMPVGTQAALKSLHPSLADETGAQIVLANTYHLFLQPGAAVVARLGGLHSFMGWQKPILTDSGGFQVFSLPNKTISENGVEFTDDKTGKSVFMGPEESIACQNDLGADIIMAFDECIPFPSTHDYTAKSVERTTRWAKRSLNAHVKKDSQALFGIVQGSVYPDLRQRSAESLVEMDFPGYAVGGVSVGEGHELMKRAVEYSVPFLPQEKVRYLMGVGHPEDIIEAVERGMDIFDCIIPTLFGRSGVFFTTTGKVRIHKNSYRKDRYPIDTQCRCSTCTRFSRAYLHHLFTVDEPLGKTLGTIHNIHFYMNMMNRMREAILQDRFIEFKQNFLGRLNTFRTNRKDDSVLTP